MTLMVNDQSVGVLLLIFLLPLTVVGGIAYGWSATWRQVGILVLVAGGSSVLLFIFPAMGTSAWADVLAMKDLSATGRGVIAGYALLLLTLTCLVAKILSLIVDTLRRNKAGRK